MSAHLTATDFPAFFIELWGHEPFPWQTRLAARVLDGGWPGLVDLPTGAGKTAALDVALFALAAEPTRHPRRIALVVDRRTIVDQAAVRARAIALALARAEAGADGHTTLARVAGALRRLAGPATRLHEEILDVAVLRGGLPRETDWARTPARPAILLSTVDQVGSRLLFRGYGVSDSMKPVHAGLLGHDLLLLLDEVHLAGPLRETLRALEPRRTGRGIPDRWRMVELSATPGKNQTERFSLDAADHAHAVLGARLRARKPVTLAPPVAGTGATARRGLHAALASATLQAAGRGRAVLLVVNRVDDALDLHAMLLQKPPRGLRVGPLGTDPMEHSADLDVRVGLVTGRMRGHERDRLGAFLARTLRPGRARDPEATGLVLVATQCVEAGADFDFDALVTECASLDALRQRAGRVDRAGVLGTAPVTVVVRAEDLADSKQDPIYGEALRFAWAWLAEQPLDTRDLGPAGPVLPDNPQVRPPAAHPPVLLPAYLDAWVQTAPRPEPDPEPALFLHGLGRGSPEVRICWRADLDGSSLDTLLPEQVGAMLAACPPRPAEIVTVPLHVARRWLMKTQSGPLGADLEGGPALVAEDKSAPVDDVVALRWAGGERAEALRAVDIAPGDLLVLPASRGGLRDGAFDPAAAQPVQDIAERAAAPFGLLLRLHPAILAGLGLAPAPRPADLAAPDSPPVRTLLDAWIDALPDDSPWSAPETRRALRRARRVELDLGGDSWWVLIGRTTTTTEAEDGSFPGGRPIALAPHLAGVGELSAAFAEAAGLPHELVEDLRLAGQLHDLGKADPRFQFILHDGDEVRAARAAARVDSAQPLGGLLAKSGGPPGDATRRARLRARAEYPEGARHELLSVALASSAPDLLTSANDPDLVLHLVASHHGHCRPLAPVQRDARPRDVTLVFDGHTLSASTDHKLDALGSGVAARFWRLVRRYGPHGLAFLEAVLRLADHRRSELEQLEDAR